MTVGEYVKKLGGDMALMGSCDVWSNAGCAGYCITAMRAAGCGQDVIDQVLDKLQGVFDSVTVDEAERAYYDG